MISISKRCRAADTLPQRARLLAAVAEGDGIFKIHAAHSTFTDGVNFLAAGIGLEIRKMYRKDSR